MPIRYVIPIAFLNGISRSTKRTNRLLNRSNLDGACDPDSSPACVSCGFINQFAITGTKVWESKKDTTIVQPMASANGKNNAPGIPTIVKAGAKTARIQNRINNLGSA